MKYNLLEHAEMAKMRKMHPNWIWNRSDTHVVLGVPGALDAYKTPVEPGNSFSPGPGSYGVSSWVYVDGKLHTPEEKLLDELEWHFEDGFLPLLNASWNAGGIGVRSRLFTHGELERNDFKDYYSVILKNETDHPITARLYLAIRSFGAAGGPISKLDYSDGVLKINDASLLYVLNEPDAFGSLSYQDSGQDICEYLHEGKLPDRPSVEDPAGWASGAFAYNITLAPGQCVRRSFVCHVQAGHWMLHWLEPVKKDVDVQAVEKEFLECWRRQLGIQLDVPDRRFTEAFNSQLVHLSMFTVHNAPRISPISYPLWWLRDGAYVVNALGKGGFHDFAREACRGVKGKNAFGGFGSEGDAPSGIIWIISEHYLLTRDRAFLEEMYPTVADNADLLIHMRHTDKPVRRLTEFVIPELMLEANMDMLCIPSRDGLIMGRMDHHFPVIWVNTFAWMGLMRAAMLAAELGVNNEKYLFEADALKEAIIKKSQEIFGQNDRDVNCAFWPTGWASKDDEFINGKFDEFWHTVRCPDGVHVPERMWTYFEAGQAHNNLLRGKRDWAWVSIEMFLSTHTAPGLYTYHESNVDENTSLQWQRTRGWDDIHYITPHGWTASEVFLLLRDCLVREEDGTLVIGSGIPDSWLDEDFSVKDMPTYYGKVSFRYNAAEKKLKVVTDGRAEVRHELPREVAVSIICV